MGISVSVNSQAVMAKLTKLKKSVGPATRFSNLDIANEILRLSQLEVPHDEGTLQDSGTVDQLPGSDDAVVGYNTIYAARLHEHPEYRFQKGRKGKYLEDPIIRNLGVLGLSYTHTFKNKTIGSL